MTSIVIAKDPYQILQDFVNNKEIDIQSVLKNNDLFKLNLHYDKYKKSVNLPAAKLIVSNQMLIYRMGALLKHNTTDIHSLTKQEKQQLEIPFEVKEGSTDISADIVEQIRRMIDMIPEKDRALVVVVLIVCFFGYKIFNRFMESKDKKSTDEKESKKELDNTNLIGKAVDKLSQANSELAELVKDYEKENLGNLEDVDDKIIYQGDEYTSEQIRELRKMKFPRKPIEVPEAKQLKGNFRVVSINLENKFLNIKNGDDVEKVFYREDLITEIQGFKKQFKSAIDNEGKTFYIEAGYTTKSGKRSPLILNTMTPIE